MKLAFAIWVTISALIAAYRLITIWWRGEPLNFPICRYCLVLDWLVGMTTRIDSAAVLDEAEDVKLADVFEEGQGRPLAGISKPEVRMIPMGKDGQPRAVLIERRRRRGDRYVNR